MPVRFDVKCSRHAGTVASHCRFAPMFASARPPCRHPLAVFLRLHFCGYRNTASTKYITEAESEGAFFSSESAEKNRTGWFGQSVSSNCEYRNATFPDGSAKACLQTAGMPIRIVGLEKNYVIRPGNHSAIAGKVIRIIKRSMSVSTKGITPLKIVMKLTSCTTLLMTNTFIPTGG